MYYVLLAIGDDGNPNPLTTDLYEELHGGICPLVS